MFFRKTAKNLKDKLVSSDTSQIITLFICANSAGNCLAMILNSNDRYRMQEEEAREEQKYNSYWMQNNLTKFSRPITHEKLKGQHQFLLELKKEMDENNPHKTTHRYRP